MAAAVADFRPKAPSDHKTKKEDGLPEIVLEPTHDFLVDLGARQAARAGPRRLRGRDRRSARQRRRQAPAQAPRPHRRQRRGGRDSGFEVDTNRAVLLDAQGGVETLPLLTKAALAEVIVDRIVALHSAGPGRAPTIRRRVPEPTRARTTPHVTRPEDGAQCRSTRSRRNRSPRAIPTRWPTRSATRCSTPSCARTRTGASRARRWSPPVSASSPARSARRRTSTSPASPATRSARSATPTPRSASTARPAA